MGSKVATQVLSTVEAFDRARMEIPRNETSRRMDDANTYKILLDAMRDLGHRRLINLAHSYEQSRIAHAFYRGDGIVVKIIPEDYLGPRSVIRHLPSISTHTVQTGTRNFKIKTYPYLAGQVTQNDIESFRAELAPLGLAFVKDDDHPGNVRRMPDAKGTLVGIDSFMYETDPTHRVITPEMEDAWHKYVHALFPIYDAAEIPAQTEETNFNFVSVHNPKAVNAHYSAIPGQTANAEVAHESPIQGSQEGSKSWKQRIAAALTMGL